MGLLGVDPHALEAVVDEGAEVVKPPKPPKPPKVEA